MALSRPSAIACLWPLAALVAAGAGCVALDLSPRPGGPGPAVNSGDNPETSARLKFQPAAPMAAPRMAFAYTAFKGRIYVFGGLTAPSWDSATDSIEVYDPLSDTWSHGGRLPWPLSFAAAGVLGDAIYIVGGQSMVKAGCPPEDESTIWKYEVSRRHFQEAGSLPDPRWGLALVPHGSGLLAVGGFQGPFAMQRSRLFESRTTATDCPTSPNPSGGSQIMALSTFITPDAVQDAAPLAQGRALAGFGTLGGTPFLTQGWVRGPDHPLVDDRSVAFDRPNNRWTDSVPPRMDTIWGPASAQVGPDAFVVAGGMHPGFESDPAVEPARSDVRHISAQTPGALSGGIRNLPALPEGRGLGGAAVVADKLYVFGGLGDGLGRAVSRATFVLRDLSAEAAWAPGAPMVETSGAPVPTPTPRFFR